MTVSARYRYLHLLFWLKWKLQWRSWTGHLPAALGVILLIIALLPMALMVAGGCLAGFLTLHPPLDQHLLRGALLGIYLVWVLFPILGWQLSESYDLTKLFAYPLSPRQIAAGVVLGSLVDLPVLLVLPTLLAIIVGFTTSAAGLPLVIVALGLFVFHTLALSQAIATASATMMRSRRFRDIMIVVVPLVGVTVYVLWQGLFHRMERIDWSRVVESSAWKIIGFSPPGLADHAIAAAKRGEYVLALGFLTGVAVLCVAAVYLMGWLVQRVYMGEVVVPAGRKRVSPPSAPPAAAEPVPFQPEGAPSRRALFGLRLPPVVEAVMDKEIKYLLREPYFKVMVLNMAFVPIVVLIAALEPWGRVGDVDAVLSNRGLLHAMMWGLTGLLLFTQGQVLFNLLGTEGAAAWLLLLSPAARRQILIGKHLALGAAFSVVSFVFLIITCALARALPLLAVLFCCLELGMVVMIAVGNLVSIWFPFRVVMRGWRLQQQRFSRGCGYGMIYMVVMAIAGVLMLPIVAALAVPSYWVSRVWFALTIPFAAAYAFGAYALSLHFAAGLMLRREPEIAASLAQSE